ncbi:hybrid sensor histidine kinase/response regulator [Desulfonema magnum]|nr:response regulator [Desulfonema magnum]
MPRSSCDEIVQGYIEEVKTYIPSLIQGLETLEERPDQSEVLEETYRLVHTIKGASAMVGIYGLSHIACQMEDALDDIIAEQLAFTDEIFRIMFRTVDYFQTYCDDFLEKGVDAQNMLRDTVLAFRRIRMLPSDGDADALRKLLEIVPEREGGGTEPEEDARTEVSEVSFSPSQADDREQEEPEDNDIWDLEKEFRSGTWEDEEARLWYGEEFEVGLGEEENLPADPYEDEEALIALLESAPEADAGIENLEEKTGSEVTWHSPDDPLPELLDSFYEEAEEHFQYMERSLNLLESQIIEPVTISPSQKEAICQLRRSVHTLKGASAVIGIPNISAFAHNAEDLLDWLYERAEQITPEIVSVLGESADLLGRIIAQPQNAHASKARLLKEQYQEIMGNSGLYSPDTDVGETDDLTVMAEKETGVARDESGEPSPVCYELFDDVSEHDIGPDMPSYQTKTLRVVTERVDDLVNLAGELIIVSSAFEQKMDSFMNAINELELSRNRLRDIAREMEVGYEVKALEHLRTPRSELRDSAFRDFDTLELDRYSELSLIIRTLNESVIDVGAINTNLANIYSEFDGHLSRNRVILSELQNKMMRVRMTPMQTIANKLRRTVHEVAGKLGKKIRLIIEGADIELDRVIWEKITDPLMHIVRNASDHGIESPEIRRNLGKPLFGTVKLSALREGNQVVIRVADDGGGLNYESLRMAARKAGLSDNVNEMSEDELANLIFQPGFSTREKISEISGRGIGMDVVKENINELKGVIRVASWKDKGTQFTIRIPLTLAVVKALLFTAGGQTFAVALNEIKEILRIDPRNITHEIEKVVKIGDEILPLYYLTRVLNMVKEDAEKSFYNDTPEGGLGISTRSDHPLVLVAESGGRRGVIVIGTLIGQREIVIKSTGSHLRYVKGVSGVTILGDGSVVPILNVEEILQTQMTEISAETMTSMENLMTEKPPEIMVVDDSVSIRQVVSRLMKDQGWKVVTAKDGIDALEKLRNSRPDMIVLDIEMPRMNGYEFLSVIRVQPAYENIPVVMLTSRTAAKHRDKAISLGVKGFVIKPYNDNEFIELVLKLTGREA